MAAPFLRRIPWDIYEEHLNEAGWLWGVWEEALDSPVYTLQDVVVGPEERLLAHLDGLVLGGRAVAERLLMPALAGDDPGGIAAAAWALLQAEDADHQEVVLGALASAEPPARAAIGRALSLSPALDLDRLVPLWEPGAPPLRALLLDLFGTREPAWVTEGLELALRSLEPSLMISSLKLIRDAGDRGWRDRVDDALQSEDGSVREEAILTGIALGSTWAWEACRHAAGESGATARIPLALLAMSPDPNDRARVRERARVPEVRRHALWALGFAGDRESAEVLVEALADDEVAGLAGEALTAVSGLAMVGQVVKPGETRGPEVREVEPDDPPPVVRPEEELPVPRADAVAKWWDRARDNFQPGVRYVYGQPRNAATLLTALATAPTWRRSVLWLELATAGLAPKVRLAAWARDQQLGSG